MSFRGRGPPGAAPRGYVPGLGRGAAGFTTRSDVGPMAQPGAVSTSAAAADGGGSRAAEARAARSSSSSSQFGVAPKGYVVGAGRGAAGPKPDDDTVGPTGYDQFGGYNDRLFGGESTPYDNDDEEADRIYHEIDERMSKRHKRNDDDNNNNGDSNNSKFNDASDDTKKITEQFRELKEQLANVSEDEWANIPDVGDYSLKYKQSRREDVFTPLTDSLLETKLRGNTDATSGNAALSATTAAAEDAKSSGFKSVVTNMSGLAEARGTVLGMSLDKMSDSVSGQTVVDPKGYLTSLSRSSTMTLSNAEVGDVNKARLLLKSVRDTNPKHGPGWIAAARVEEAAGKIHNARKLIQEGCETCPDNEDVWLEAARLHPPANAKTILATAVRRIPTSVKLFLRAADLEPHDSSKKAVLRKALESNPTSVTLWKSAIELEEADDARILLGVAVEKVPHSVEMWLALARLETYENAKAVLNQARKALPAERAVWIAAAKLEESQNHAPHIDAIIEKAVKTLAKHDAVVSRAQWLQEAETAEASGAPLTSGAIVKHTLGMNVDVEDRQRTWSDDAASALSRGAVATARAILAHSLAVFPAKRSLWLGAMELERKHGSADSLDEVLAAASERMPRVEIFWLVRAKEKWLANQVDMARDILTKAFAANPESEAVWLAAAKLEWENSEVERARVLLRRARDRAPTNRVYMKSAILERECQQLDDALDLIEEGIQRYPTFAKFYMMGGQICSDDLTPKSKYTLDRARKFYQRGLQACPNSIVLWTLASHLEERAFTFEPQKGTDRQNGNGGTSTNGFAPKSTNHAGVTKARSLFELARLKNPKEPELWVEAIRLERRAGNDKLAGTLMARALQECPTSGLLLAENIRTAPRVEQKSKSADAIKKCPDDHRVISAVASLFASERKTAKARKWFDRAVVLDPDQGDSWAKYYALELETGTPEQQANIKERCIAAEPHHGELWCTILKQMSNHRKTVAEGLQLVTKHIMDQKSQTQH